MASKKSNNFQKCKKTGDEGENLAATILKNIGNLCIVSNEERKYYDLILQIKNKEKIGQNYLIYKFEVKYDHYFKKSNNLAIEVFNTKKKEKSGLAITKADFWIHVLDKEIVLLTNVCILKDFCRRNRPLKIIENAGDGNARLYIYKYEHIKDIFTNIYQLPKNKLLRILNDVF